MKINIKISKRQILWLIIFSISMGLLEAVVVVYLRELYYPEGFQFPLQPIENYTIALAEFFREAATILMLFGVGYLFGRNFITRFAGFLLSFAIWDIFYYVFLKILLNWPESFFTWDVLFLIPTVWVGPVLAPIIVSFTMIYYAFIFLILDSRNSKLAFGLKNWSFLLIPTFIIFLAFIFDSTFYLIDNYGLYRIFTLTESELFSSLIHYIPTYFNWYIFGAGELGLIAFIIYFWRNNSKAVHS